MLPISYCIVPGLSATSFRAQTVRGCWYLAVGRRAIPSTAPTITRFANLLRTVLEMVVALAQYNVIVRRVAGF